MPSGAQTSAGSTIAISAALPATYDQAGYEALTFTIIGDAVTLPAYGRTSNLVTHNPLGDRKTYKFKGSYDNGSVPLALAIDTDDPGQIILQDYDLLDDSASFEITLQDGSKEYTTGKVMSYTTEIGGVDSITAGTAQLEFDADIIKVAAP